MISILRKVLKVEVQSLLEDEALNYSNLEKRCEGREMVLA